MISEPKVDVTRRDDDRETHLDEVVDALSMGSLTIFLGAGANACSRPPEGLIWQAEQAEHLPLGKELADHLANKFKYPSDFDGQEDLARVAQWIALEKKIGALYDHLEVLFQRKYPPTALHQFLASLPGLLRPKGYPLISREDRRYLLVTANYDDLLERAFAEAEQPVHVVTYRWENQEEIEGGFFHRRPDNTEVRVPIANKYEGFLDTLPIILKIHGTAAGRPSLVITENHFLSYIDSTPKNPMTFFPKPIGNLLLRSSFLFLGYALKDWNLRIILRRIWRERPEVRKMWSIQVEPDKHDKFFWDKQYDVKILNWPLTDYTKALRERVEALSPVTGDTSA